eukprot:2457804-Amphidinium_carterae.1
MSQFPGPWKRSSICPDCATGACHEPHCGAGILLRRLSTCPNLCRRRVQTALCTMEQIVDVPVPQTVEQIVNVPKISPSGACHELH